MNLLKASLRRIKLLAMDFDGIMTDGYVYINQNGQETVRCSRKDGLGIDMLKRAGIGACVISKETNLVVMARCKKLKIQCWQKVKDSDSKLAILKTIMLKNNLAKEEVAYFGDDLNDVAALNYAGVSLTVADAHPKVKALVSYITKAKGGEHAVREVAELILSSQGHELKL